MKKLFIEQYGIDRYNKLKNDNNELYKFCFYTNDDGIVKKLLTLENTETFWDNVRKFTKNIYSDRNISSWQRLAELRYLQIEK